MRSDKDGYYSEEDFEKEFEGQLSDLGEEPKRGTKKKRKGSNAGKKKGKNKKKRNRKKTVIIVLICFILLILAGVAMGYSFLMNKFDKVDQVELEVGDLDIDPKVSEDLKNYRNIAILAIDSRAAYDEDPETARTDGIIIASINKKTKEVKMASVYRDSYLDVEEAGKHVIDKVNHAHAYGGPTNTLRAINRNLDLNVQEFIRMDWMTVANVTDSMGGLEVEVTEATRKELNHIITSSSRALGVYQPADIQEAGKQTLTGTQIVGFCRMRYTDGDDHRAGRMREVINASFDKAKKLKLSELNETADLALSEIKTSISSKELMSILLDLGSYKIGESIGWPYEFQGAMINGVSYDVPVTLKSNVVKLHEDLFGQEGYTPTQTVLDINERIKEKSGVYGNEGKTTKKTDQ